MTIDGDTGTLADHLLALPLTDLVPHEHVDPARLRRIARRIVGDGELKDPVLATRLPDRRWLVIDGAHRMNALRRIGVRRALIQAVPADGLTIRAWHHLVDTTRALGRLLTSDCPRCAAASPQGVCVATVSHGGRMWHAWTEETDVTAAASLMNALYACYAGRYERVAADEVGHDGSRTRVAYAPWTLGALSELTARGVVLPAGVTRFVVPGRVLGACVPLALLSAPDGDVQAHHWLKDRDFRYYAEPVYVAE